MTTTPDLGIPELAQSQALPEITHNEALVLVQALLNGVIDKDLSTPPVSPTEGDSYIVNAGGGSPAASGAWVGRDNSIAIFWAGSWRFVPGVNDAGTPITMSARQEGLRVYVRDEDALYIWTGSPLAWTILSAGGVSDGDKGDVTVSGGGTVWTVDELAGVLTKTNILWEPDAITLTGTTLDLSGRAGDFIALTFDSNDIAAVTLDEGDEVTLVAQDAGVIEFDGSALITPTGDDLIITAGQVIVLRGTPAGVIVVNDNFAWHVESGTWTPELTFTTPGDLSGAYSIQNADYVINGKVINGRFDARRTMTYGSASGQLLATGFPVANGYANVVWVAAGVGQGITMDAARVLADVLLGISPAGTSALIYYNFSTAGGVSGFDVINASPEIPTGSVVRVSCAFTWETP